MITINRESILPALTNVNKVVDKKHHLPILQNVLVRIRDGRMLLVATDLELDIQTLVPDVTVTNVDPFTLPAKKFETICKSLPKDADIKIAIKDGGVTVQSGQARFSLHAPPAQDYPHEVRRDPIDTFTIESRILKHLLARTSFSMADKDARQYLNGTLLDIRQGKLCCVATDGHRLALCDTRLDAEVADRQVLLPRKAVLELTRILENTETLVTVECGAGFCRFNIGDTVLTTKLLEGKYPDYQRVIPSNLDKKAIINKNTLRSALTRASLLSNDQYKGVKLNFSEGKLKLEAANNESETVEEEIDADFQGDDVFSSFNIGYLLDVVRVLSGENVTIEITDHISSVMLRDDDDDSASYIVMPMRL